eukprot:SAG11_NODE_17857_length_507_cov_0.879902_2_plen_70_part_00
MPAAVPRPVSLAVPRPCLRRRALACLPSSDSNSLDMFSAEDANNIARGLVADGDVEVVELSLLITSPCW